MIILKDIIEKYKKLQLEFYNIHQKDGGYKTMKKVEAIVNDLKINFDKYDGNTLSNYQIELSGMKFFLAKYLSNIERVAESLKLEVKKVRADKWEEISEEIKAKYGKVKNKEQIENELMKETYEIQQAQVLFETFFYQFKLKISAVNDILTCIVQKLSFLKKELEQTNNQ